MKKNIVHSKETKQNISAVLIHTNKQKFKCTSHVLGMVPSWCFSSVFEVQKSILFCGQHGLVSWFNNLWLIDNIHLPHNHIILTMICKQMAVGTEN